MSARIVMGMALASALLAGCGASDVREVQDWMDQVRRDTHPSVKPLPEPKDFLPYAYGAKDAVDPFNPTKLLGELARAAATSDNPNQPDMQRPRELLETFPLDTMQMVGTIEKGGARYALLQVDRSLYQVTTGQRIGQNFGVVTHVGEDAVDIREVVQDAAGEWTGRMTKLELQIKENHK
ncbi:pilus assembly protein PilP [Massilia rhizosphaerae]|jgi:type IV pilus assembly protein PilP|uniref:pilus assembly protein PilP n=1 Tax=Massilia rhizosphaerae TaxID=2784389 RepID=UPI001E356E2C|nr:pilus assembly protein PilP [Massilia rhizosphaerae]